MNNYKILIYFMIMPLLYGHGPKFNRKIEFPHGGALFTLDSHNTSYFFKREDGTYYWLHCRKGKDDVYVDADEMQLDLLGNDPILSKEYIMKSIY